MANRLFVQDGGVRINAPLVERVQLFRSVLGLLATLALAFIYGKGEETWNGAASDGFGNLITTPVLLIVTGPLVVLGFILYAPPHLRPVLRSRKARSRRSSAPCWAARCRSRPSPCGSCGGCEPATELRCVADLGRIAKARKGVDPT
ncbi:hypothetical protein ACFCWG_15880 [Streptomyces sp. NPDC056390]|uniref:hypothetical protein n=1 Tax=Streptomyces sp. NPDC056390 TaxID=3345806 RepID=UPI0035E34AA3